MAMRNNIILQNLMLGCGISYYWSCIPSRWCYTTVWRFSW